MKYTIEYKSAENHNLNNTLFIYDFGHIKGFLYNDNFTMYKILNKDDTVETVELYEGIIPKTVFSVEQYNSEYSDGIYKLQDFDVLVKASLKAESLPYQPLHQQLLPSHSQQKPRGQHQQQQQRQQPQQQHQRAQQVQQKKHAYIPRNNQVAVKAEIHLNSVNEKVQQVVQVPQYFSMSPNAAKPQWTSLEQLMKEPLTSADQLHQKQRKQLKPHSPLSKPKLSSSSQVRPRQAKVETHAQM